MKRIKYNLIEISFCCFKYPISKESNLLDKHLYDWFYWLVSLSKMKLFLSSMFHRNLANRDVDRVFDVSVDQVLYLAAIDRWHIANGVNRFDRMTIRLCTFSRVLNLEY